MVLASKSPRRQELLGRLGLDWVVRTQELDEHPQPGEIPETMVRRLARSKAAAVDLHPGEIVIAADTIVVLEGELMGKPGDAAEARHMLQALRGRPHDVLTGLALRRAGELWVEVVPARVYMRSYSDAEIAAYVASGAPMDKAGAYGVQDRPFEPVRRLEGCGMAVVGLPLCRLVQALQRWRVTVPGTAREICPDFVGSLCPRLGPASS
ncbi:MAG: septum formation protein Maf [Chloroflexia bacterium]|nr:septum formation protein Maf [Chloroflexia bacterium]